MHLEEEGGGGEEEQSPGELLQKSSSPREARELKWERTRVQSKRLEWFQEVGRAEVWLWGCHGPPEGMGALLQEVLTLGRQRKEEVPQPVD